VRGKCTSCAGVLVHSQAPLHAQPSGGAMLHLSQTAPPVAHERRQIERDGASGRVQQPPLLVREQAVTGCAGSIMNNKTGLVVEYYSEKPHLRVNSTPCQVHSMLTG
jgi:hypothetical protein